MPRVKPAARMRSYGSPAGQRGQLFRDEDFADLYCRDSGDSRRLRVWDGDTRRIFADAGRRLVVKVPQRHGQAYFPEDDLRIDLETMTSTCLGGQATQSRESRKLDDLPPRLAAREVMARRRPSGSSSGAEEGK